MTTESHGYEWNTSSWRYLLKLEYLFDRNQPVNEIIATEATVKFWYINPKISFPTVIIVIFLL